MQGEITGGGSPLDGDGLLAEASEQLRAAAGDARVKAVLLQIDSPGGGLAASDQLHHEVEKLGRTGKPVVAWAGGVMASGGYYLAAAASGIMAGPTAVVGSIGVVMNHFQAAGLLRWLGIRADPIISGPRKDIGSPFREMTREEREILQARVDDSHRRFVALVAKGRKLPPEKVEELAGGDVFSAEEARENGLVDRIGYVDDALEWLEELSGGRGMRVIGYRRPPSLYDLVGEIGEAGAAAFWKGSLAELEPAPLMGF
ncbi:MAG: signal peptide peptidase SppA [Planctomycetota bacterium]|nr:signal peptide peptidase SppA [Planctomycetota bacterium]